LANSVACCAVADAVMAGEPPIVPMTCDLEWLNRMCSKAWQRR